MSELNKNDCVELYCYTCKGMKTLRVVENNKNGLFLQCEGCKKDLRITADDFIQKESEKEIVYTVDTLEKNFKIGQNVFHPIFNDNGVIVGKSKEVICVKFYQNGFKKLAMNVFQKKG